MTNLFNINREEQERIRYEKQNEEDAWKDFALIRSMQPLQELDLEHEIVLHQICWKTAENQKRDYPSAAIARKNIDKLFPKYTDTTHNCSYETCSYFHMNPNVKIVHPDDPSKFVISSGTLHICKSSGKIHCCPLNRDCDKTVLASKNKQDGYVCKITGIYKRNIMTAIPKFDEENPIGTKTLQKMQQKEEHDEYSFTENEFIIDESSNFEKHTIIDEFDKDSLYRICTENNIDYRTFKALKKHGLENSHDITKFILKERESSEIISQTQTKKRKRFGKRNQSASDRIRALRQKIDPHQEIPTILRLVSGKDAKNYIIDYYSNIAWNLAGKKTLTEQNRHSKRNLPEMTQLLVFFREYYNVCNNCIMCDPDLYDPHLVLPSNLKECITALITKAWNIILDSDYLFSTQKSKNPPINFTRISIALIYITASTGLLCDPSVSEEELSKLCIPLNDPIYSQLPRLRIRVIPHIQILNDYLIPPKYIEQLRSWSNNSFESNVISTGEKQIKNCFVQIFQHVKEKYIQMVQKTPSEAITLFKMYIAECQSKKCDII